MHVHCLCIQLHKWRAAYLDTVYTTLYTCILFACMCMHFSYSFAFSCILYARVCNAAYSCSSLHTVKVAYKHMHTFVVCIHLHNIARQGALESCSHAMMHTVSFGVAPFWEAIKCVNMHRYSCIKTMQQYALNCIWLHYYAYDVCCIQMHSLHTNTYSLDLLAFKPSRLIAYLLHTYTICQRLPALRAYRSIQ